MASFGVAFLSLQHVAEFFFHKLVNQLASANENRAIVFIELVARALSQVSRRLGGSKTKLGRD